MATDTPADVELTKENFAQSLDGCPFAVVDFRGAMVWPLPRVCAGFRGGRAPAS